MDKQTPINFFKSILGQSSQWPNIHSTLTARLQQDIKAMSDSPALALQQTFISQCIDLLQTTEQFQSGKTAPPAPYLPPYSNTPTAFKILCYMHPAIVQKFPQFPTEIQDAVRAGLLNIVITQYKCRKCMATLGALVREIVQIDAKVKGGFNQWVQPINQIIKWMSSQGQNSAQSQAGIQFFIYFYKQTSFTSSNSQLPLHKLSNPLLQSLFQIFTSSPSQPSVSSSSQAPPLRQKILYLVLQILKSFSSYDGSDDAIVRECFNDTVEMWMSLFVSILKGNIGKNFGMKKYVVKILVVIFRDMGNFYITRINQDKGTGHVQILTAWQFAYRFIPVYICIEVFSQTQCNGQQISNHGPLPYFDQDYDISFSPIQSLTHNILQLLSVLSSSTLFPLTVKLSLHHITNSLFHYYLPSWPQSQSFLHNGLYFTGPPQYESIRGKIVNILNDLIQKNGDIGIQAVLLIAEKFLMGYKQKETVQMVNKLVDVMGVKDVIDSGRVQLPIKIDDLIRFVSISGYDFEDNWRRSQTALGILGRFSQDIIVFQAKQQGAFDIQNFVKGLIKQFSIQDHNLSTYILKGQSLYCLTRFTQIISIRYKHLFTDLVTSCSSCIAENYPLSVRVAACKSMTIFFRKMEKHKLKLAEEQKAKFQEIGVFDSIMSMELNNQSNSYALEALIQIVKCLGTEKLGQSLTPLYILDNVHKNISHPNTLKLCFSFLQLVCSEQKSYQKIILATSATTGQNGQQIHSNKHIIPHFIQDCLETYINIIKSDQKKYLKGIDIDLISTVLKFANIIIQKCPISLLKAQNQIVHFTPLLAQIIKYNQNLQIHIACTICLKNLIKLTPKLLKQHDKSVLQSIHSLLKIPQQKTFQGASIYVGNLILLTSQFLLQKPDQQILQEVVLKIFKSRTPSVIQSLVLVYSRMINGKTDRNNIFAGEWEGKLRNITDFLASFSIENRMGLKILVDKWLLQQSLFRGTYTKISTFMALSKMFLLRDKRIDNLLVIGFNPSHTNISNDVNAPLKILATLIRCLNNEMGGKDEQNEDAQQSTNFQMKQQPQKSSIEVGLQKFKQTSQQLASKNQAVGGLADRQNQQGSTCYMSAMLQFYDDGEECDETTEQDLIFLQDSSTKFTLSQYLTDFFLYLNSTQCVHHQYFLDCLRHLLKEDVKILQKYVKVAV